MSSTTLTMGEYFIEVPEGSLTSGSQVIRIDNIGAQPHFVAAGRTTVEVTNADIEAVLESEMTGTPVYGMKVLSDRGSGYWSWIICGINETAKQEIPVANMSLGGASSEDPSNCASSSLHQAICDAVNQGVRFAVAAGNDGKDASGYVPAKYPEVTTVSALADSDGCTGGLGSVTGYGADDSRATFSNYGGPVDVAAPGVGIRSTFPAVAMAAGTAPAWPAHTSLP